MVFIALFDAMKNQKLKLTHRMEKMHAIRCVFLFNRSTKFARVCGQ